MTPINAIFSFCYLSFWDYYTKMTFLTAKEARLSEQLELKGTSGSSCPKSWIGSQFLDALIQRPGERKTKKAPSWSDRSVCYSLFKIMKGEVHLFFPPISCDILYSVSSVQCRQLCAKVSWAKETGSAP